MVRDDLSCPECGHPLSVIVEKDEKTGEIGIEFWCESGGEDKFGLQILTGLTNDDLDEFEAGKVIQKEMTIKLLARESDSCEDI